jgi:hypothetical protein
MHEPVQIPLIGFDQPIRGDINERDAMSRPFVDISMPSSVENADHLRDWSGCRAECRRAAQAL